jgi:HK97 family phage prohead protease
MKGALPISPFAREAKFLGEPPRRIRLDGMFEGYASLFRVADLGRDIVEPGAFRESLVRRGPAGVKLLWQHDPAEPIGRWLSLAEDSRGLFVRGQLSLSVGRAREILALMREGAVDGLSIGFRPEKARTEPRTGLRRLDRVDLWEISIVTFPMLPQARVSAVKAMPRDAFAYA